MLAQSKFGPKQLHRASSQEMLSMLEEIGSPWSDQPGHFRLGSVIHKTSTDAATMLYTPHVFTDIPTQLLDLIPTYDNPQPSS